MYQVFVFAIIVCLLNTSFAAAADKDEQRFWKKVEKDLTKQKKAIEKNLKKKKIGELEIEYQRLILKNKLGLKYNVPETLVETSGDMRTSYAFFAGTDYATSFKVAVENKIKQYASFTDYLETTGQGHKARACRFKRAALLTGGVTLMSLAVAGGVMGAILIPNVIAGIAMTIRPVTVVFLAFLGVGAPVGGPGIWHATKIQCIGER